MIHSVWILFDPNLFYFVMLLDRNIRCLRMNGLKILLKFGLS